MPCGSGKSLTALWISARLSANKVVIAVPSLALVKQTLTTWMTEAIAHGDYPDWLCVCGDESAGQVSSDDLISFAHDLAFRVRRTRCALPTIYEDFNGPSSLVITT